MVIAQRLTPGEQLASLSGNEIVFSLSRQGGLNPILTLFRSARAILTHLEFETLPCPIDNTFTSVENALLEFEPILGIV
jgi:hypothetical protein